MIITTNVLGLLGIALVSLVIGFVVGRAFTLNQLMPTIEILLNFEKEEGKE